MQIQKYQLANPEQGSYFGKHRTIQTPDYEWFTNERGDIGLRITPARNPAINADCFLNCFISMPDELVLIKNIQGERVVQKESNSFGKVIERPENLPQFKSLLDIIANKEHAHAFLSSRQDDGRNPSLLTFSLTAPSKELYVPYDIVPVVISRSFFE